MCNLKLYSVNDGRDTPDEEEYEEEEEEEGDNEVRILSLSRLIIKIECSSTWTKRLWNSLRTGFSTKELLRSLQYFEFKNIFHCPDNITRSKL